ncbi:MAG TPA: hypothetical protein VGG81_03470 [Edaphobacter sp.]|jgi:hypothetical protein
MNPALARLLTRLYPRRWRERYGAEFEAFLQTGPGGFGTWRNVIYSALHEHIAPTQGGNMNPNPNSFRAILKHPSAFLPVAMSLAALGVLFAAAIYGILHGAHGIIRQPDEGTAAHLWQLLMAGQLPVLLFFAIKWLPRAPRQTLYVLALQAGAALASIAPVFLLGL